MRSRFSEPASGPPALPNPAAGSPLDATSTPDRNAPSALGWDRLNLSRCRGLGPGEAWVQMGVWELRSPYQTGSAV